MLVDMLVDMRSSEVIPTIFFVGITTAKHRKFNQLEFLQIKNPSFLVMVSIELARNLFLVRVV